MSAAPIGGQFLASPSPWVALTAVFIGAALSRATTRIKGARDPARARTRKWVLVCVYLSLSVIFGLLGVFLPGPEKVVDLRLAYLAGAIAVPAFICMRFKKSIGIPVVLLLLCVLVLFSLLLRSLHAFTGETEIAVVRVVAFERNAMRLELIPRDRSPVLLNMEGDYFAPIVKVVIFSDPFVFLGAKTWYRFEGVTSFMLVKEADGYKFRQGNTDFYFPQPQGISESLWRYFERYERRIPGVKTVQVEMDLKHVDARVKEFAVYGIRVQNDGGVQIVPLSD